MKRSFRTALLLVVGVAVALPATANAATAASPHASTADTQLIITSPDSDWPW